MSKHLSVSRKADRLRMAALVKDLGHEFDCEIETAAGGSYPGERCIQVSLAAPGGLQVTVKFDGESSLRNTFVLSWHMALCSNVRLDPVRFGEVNPHHFQKATHIAEGFEHLTQVLRRDLAMAKDGSAYQAAVQ